MRENSILKERILQYLDFKGVKPAKFYEDTGVSNGVLSQDNGLSEANLMRFLNYYSDVNPNWLLTGKGEMLLEYKSYMEPKNWILYESGEHYSKKFDSAALERVGLRIAEIMEYYNIEAKDFAKSITIETDDLWQYISGKEAVSDFVLDKILQNYPEINPVWLHTGRQAMRKVDDNITVRQLKTDRTIDNQNIPLYDLVASAGVNEIFGESNLSVPLDYIRIPNLPKSDGALYVRGDSMYPLLKAGDIVIYKIVHDKQQIIWGEMYLCHLLCNGDEYFFTKFIKKGEREGFALFVSQNQHHQPVEFPIDCIQSLALIKASIRINSQI